MGLTGLNRRRKLCVSSHERTDSTALPQLVTALILPHHLPLPVERPCAPFGRRAEDCCTHVVPINAKAPVKQAFTGAFCGPYWI